MRPLKVKINITVDEDLVGWLKEKAEKDERSLSQYINLILKKYRESREDGADKTKSPL